MHTLHWQVRDDKHNNAIQPKDQQEENQRAQIVFCLSGSNEQRQRAVVKIFSIFQNEADAQSHHETPETTGSESLLRHNHLLLRVTVLLCNRNVCACLSSICGGICFILCSLLCLPTFGIDSFQMLFLSEHTTRIRRGSLFL